MKAYGNDLNPQEQAMAAFLHDTNMYSGGINRHIRCLKSMVFTLSLNKEQTDLLWAEIRGIEGKHEGMLRQIDKYYEKFKLDFPQTNQHE